jgi:hypothetical protein
MREICLKSFVVNNNTSPPFTQISAICSGATLAALPTISNNGISGVWAPALNNTATTTYTFTPANGQCAISAKMTISVNLLSQTPTALPQTYCAGETVANLVAIGISIKWYTALTGGPALATTTALANVNYYASQTVSGCESLREPVIVTITTAAQPIVTSPQVFCTGATVSDFVVPTGATVLWYSNPTGGVALASNI